VASTYNLTHLALNDVTDATWALAYVRFALRDKPNAGSAYPALSLSDEELAAMVDAMSLTHESVVYYPAHRIAAKLLLANPEWVQRYSAGGYSEEVRDAAEIAKGIISGGSWIDAAINTATDGDLTLGQIRLRL
jgi:hypothetical protein